MILAWVMSLLLLCSSLIMHLEGLSSLRIIEVNTMQLAKRNFIAAEKSVLECEKSVTNIAELKENNCFIQSVGKNRWLISSKEKPSIQIGVVIDEKTGTVTRVNWRQVFE
jgi:NRPS condensation-like uncharacterized protein